MNTSRYALRWVVIGRASKPSSSKVSSAVEAKRAGASLLSRNDDLSRVVSAVCSVFNSKIERSLTTSGGTTLYIDLAGRTDSEGGDTDD